METIINAIKTALEASNTICIRYACQTTRTNSAYVEAYIGDTKIATADEYRVHMLKSKIENAVSELKSQFPHLHTICKKTELHFYFPGFNSCSHEDLVCTISNNDISKEFVKTGKVTLNLSMCGSTRVLKAIEEHPDYEIYYRHGFGFRGAQEREIDKNKEYTIWYREGFSSKSRRANWKEYIENELKNAACSDLKIVDNEIHINTFSYSDME